MSNFLFSLNVVAPLFVLMAMGYIARQIRFVSDDFLAELNRFVFRFCLPLMLFQDIRHSYSGDFSNLNLILASLIGMTVIILLLFVLVPLFIKRKGERGSMIQGIYRSNFLIYGLPLATGMYGDEVLASISMLMGILIPFYNITAVIVLSIYSENNHQISIKSILKDIVTNPLIIGCFFGLLGGMVHLTLPRFLEIPLSQLATMAAPLALFVVGGEFKFGSFRNNLVKVLVATAARLIVIPVAILFVFVLMGFRNVDLAVLISIFATPTAMSSYIMAKNMGNDATLSAQIVILTTACSSVTIFLIVFFLRSWGYL
ncbi:AEC family transporter [Bacteroidales bacterium OttesenSCG-928-L19]|nr:AEC family transporter [Bacteroidales bacterium OttesenSCG-928-L19]